MLPRVISGELDLAVVETSLALDDDRLAVEPLPKHQAVLFCRSGHPLTGINDLSIDDVRRYPFTSTALPSRVNFLSADENGAPSVELPNGSTPPQVRAETPDLARRIVMESDAVSVGIPSQIAADVALGRLITLPLELPGIETNYGIIRRAGPFAIAGCHRLQGDIWGVESELA